MSWRDALVALVVLLALYILTTFLRINRMRSESLRAKELPPAVIQRTRLRATAPESKPPKESVSPVPRPAVKPRAGASARSAPREERPPERQESGRVAMLEEDMAQLRREIGGLRAEMQALRDEQARETEQTQLARSVSPFYSDAMQLATRGNEAADISAVCGISRAEAELVVALAKNGGHPEMAADPAER